MLELLSFSHYNIFLRMIKRIAFYLMLSIFVISSCALTIYLINPFSVESENIRPRLFASDIYSVPTKSMKPLLQPDDYILVSNSAYLKTKPKRRDVIVFTLPAQNNTKNKVPYIKRVIAIAGETIEMNKGKLWVNNNLIEESYIDIDNNQSTYSQTMKPTIVPNDHLFVMGDNRDNSSDSRIFGTVAEKDVIAKATRVIYGANNRSGMKIE